MASGPHTYVTLSFHRHTLLRSCRELIPGIIPLTTVFGHSWFPMHLVFSPERFRGNPLAIVAVRGNALSQQKKSLIAKEFGYSETVFIHDAPSPGMPRRLDIFTEKGEEIPFAGHPVVGAAHYIYKYCESAPYYGPQDRNTPHNTTIMTKAGPISVAYNSYRQVAACSIPHDFHIHQQRISFEKVLAVQPQVQIVPTMDKIRDKKFPLVSIVKGMTFVLVDLTDAPEILADLNPGQAPEVQLDEDWKPSFVGALYYKKKPALEKSGEPTIHAIQARMITQGIEDPGTGSASCALASYLALSEDTVASIDESEITPEKLAEQASKVKLEDPTPDKKTERQIYAIQQGTEMGRTCTIAVEVDLRMIEGKRKIAGITLSGRASFFSEGQLIQ